MSFKVDRRRACPVEKYAKQVLDGKIVTGKLVKLACERHFRDIENGEEHGLYFDREASERAIYFMETLRHTKGEWGGRRLQLGDWQKFCIGSIFGWKWKETGLRRFRKAYEEVARKNGKSTKCGGFALYMLAADDEPGAEVYTAATKRDQARIVFDEAKNMIRALPADYMLRKVMGVYNSMLVIERTASKMMPLSADAKSMDGLNPHACVIDELHAHRSRAVYDVIDTAFGSRRQPILFAITTAGYDRHSVCWDERTYAVKVLEGIIQDDSLFAYVATIDEDDDPFDEDVWVKANPNLGVSVKLDYIRAQANKAREVASFYNEFLRLHLNVWTEAESRWMDISFWDKSSRPVIFENLYDRSGYGGLDLSSTTDLSAKIKLFPPRDNTENWEIVPQFWIPEDNIRKRVERDHVPYDVWVREGFITPTSGNVIDHEFIKESVLSDHEDFDILEWGFDPYNATMLQTSLMNEGLSVVNVRQGFLSLSSPTKLLETLVLGAGLAHGGNPVLRWMFSNVVIQTDPAGNVKPAKDKSVEKIDGIVALIIALALASAQEQEQAGYTASHGVIAI